MEVLIAAVVFSLAGGAAGFVFARSASTSSASALKERSNQLARRVDELTAERELLLDQLNDARQQAAVSEANLANSAANESRLAMEFARLSKATLAEQSEVERARVESMVKPVQDNLAKLEAFIQTSEKAQHEMFGGLFQEMKSMAEQSSRVGREAQALKNVLRSSHSKRGRWGEVQLRRVVELAGMVEHADFTEQTSVSNGDGRQRADLVVYLPGQVAIAVDAKVPYAAYEQAQTTDDPVVQKQLLDQHAKQFRKHVDDLVARAYWDAYTPSCGFSVLFVPGEALLDSACQQDPLLWEAAASRNILLATPSTLIALLRMAALGWRQEAQAGNAEEITKVGRELYKRLVKVAGEADKLGRGLTTAVSAFNGFVGSFDARVLPQARRLSELGAGDHSLSPLVEIDLGPRALNGANVVDGDEAELSGQLFNDDVVAGEIRRINTDS